MNVFFDGTSRFLALFGPATMRSSPQPSLSPDHNFQTLNSAFFDRIRIMTQSEIRMQWTPSTRSTKKVIKCWIKQTKRNVFYSCLGNRFKWVLKKNRTEKNKVCELLTRRRCDFLNEFCISTKMGKGKGGRRSQSQIIFQNTFRNIFLVNSTTEIAHNNKEENKNRKT